MSPWLLENGVSNSTTRYCISYRKKSLTLTIRRTNQAMRYERSVLSLVCALSYSVAESLTKPYPAKLVIPKDITADALTAVQFLRGSYVQQRTRAFPPPSKICSVLCTKVQRIPMLRHDSVEGGSAPTGSAGLCCVQGQNPKGMDHDGRY